MTIRNIHATGMSDDELIAEVKRLASAERRATAALVRSLMELEARRLYLREGCSSLFTWCTQVLHLEEGAAYNRIEVARAARRFPLIVDMLEDGSLTLTAARLLAPHLTEENHGTVLASARHVSKREVERLVAALRPRPDAPVVIRRVPAAARQVAQESREPAGARGNTASTESSAASALSEQVCPAVASSASTSATRSAPSARPRVIEQPLAPGRVKLQLTISEATHEKLRRARDLSRHANPAGDLDAILDRALTLLIENLERRRFAVTTRPRAAQPSASDSRHVPAAVRRAVWTRDGGQCAFVGAHGRCTERTFLEFHHVQPYAAGGAATIGNVELRCRAHNQHEASLYFGMDGLDSVRESAAVYGNPSRASREARTPAGGTQFVHCRRVVARNDARETAARKAFRTCPAYRERPMER